MESATDDPLIVTYLRHFSMSRYGLVREKELFGVIKRKITNKKLAVQFSTDLSNTSKIYASLINADHELWSKYDTTTRNSVVALNLLGMVQVRPLLIAILDRLDPRSVSAAFRKLVAAAVRFQIVGGAGGGTLERIYSEAARGVTDGTLKTIADILKVFTTLPTDSAFIAAFSVASISKQALARYYLRTLESESPETTGELVPNADPKSVNLEHILPITPSPYWTQLWSTDDTRAFQRRLGNMAILSAKVNSTVGNDTFETKRRLFEASPFKFTAMIADFPVWNKASIDQRQIEMAKVAAKIWSVRP
ncbi:HNH endonuclease family protein [Acidiphilium sp. 37-64-53]|uniref:HNH endonuclease family protein n=1 Tax=Acidiphilium sp. 37-64-53 TaxID=1970299 RepID=UPI00257A380B|nr:HNH endonuclease family protein [Acidiphilium sp. 37-64-53]